MSSNVRVALRLKPSATASLIDVHFDKVLLRNHVDPSFPATEFEFDRVFTGVSSQEDIFEYIKPSLSALLEGRNVSILAYGPTGSGKTYTMVGRRDDKGLTSRCVDELFRLTADRRFEIGSSYLEIYNEKIQDLLSPTTNAVQIFPNHLKNLRQERVKRFDEFERLFEEASKKRATAATRLNVVSSRSHSVVILKVHCLETKTVGKLYLVDLAGSENNRFTGNQGERMRESCCINTSLFTLGKVINALVQGKKTCIPYRDSKLTRVLQDALGGTSTTTLIATVSQESQHYSTTMTTLNYASRGREIINRPGVVHTAMDSVPDDAASGELDQHDSDDSLLLHLSPSPPPKQHDSDDSLLFHLSPSPLPKPAVPRTGFTPFAKTLIQRMDRLEEKIEENQQLNMTILAADKPEVKSSFYSLPALQNPTRTFLRRGQNALGLSRKRPSPLESIENRQKESEPLNKLPRRTSGYNQVKEQAESRLLNKFNFGSNSDLRRLNGIGAKKASYIISWREGKETLSSLSQITVIPGISHNAIQRLLEEEMGRIVNQEN
ncbi:kinesin-like protein KIF22 [Oscarella lobularis]|uniref:kinesin-like protein KIF22 n=1 Tax=Oscarella lobularis TaxID=121494 RepID=UPI00331362B6